MRQQGMYSTIISIRTGFDDP